MIQPLDQGVINTFKSIYKNKLNARLESQIESSYEKTYYDFQKEFRIIDSVKLFLESWNNMSTESIINCYRKAIDNAIVDYKDHYLISLLLKIKKKYLAMTKMKTLKVFFENVMVDVSTVKHK
ncbi:Tigger transposable element-derived protein 1 [Dictyocoela muelleri]|nr:Tigger transposable element-derived protein 1 [Dictyocoela muelleri]